MALSHRAVHDRPPCSRRRRAVATRRSSWSRSMRHVVRRRVVQSRGGGSPARRARTGIAPRRITFMSHHVILLTYGEPPTASFVDQLVYSWRILLGLT